MKKERAQELILLGAVIIGFMLFVTNFVLAPEDIQRIQVADYMCNAQVLGIPVGSLTQSLSQDVAAKCQLVGFFMPIIKYGIYIYALGILILIIGVGYYRGEKNSATSQSISKNSEHIPKEENPLKILKIRYAKGEISKKEFEKKKKDLEG